MKVFKVDEFIEKLNWLVYEVPNFYYSKVGTWCNFDDTRKKFMMDCVVSIKGLLWGFTADKNKLHGGGVYLSNGVQDFGANEGINYCQEVTTDFSHLQKGEYLCMKGTNNNHAGIYLGNGKVFECTTGWGASRCIISNIDKYGNRTFEGKTGAKWTYHGKLIYIDYTQPVEKDGENFYLKNSNYKGFSIVDALKQINVKSDYSYRKQLALLNGIENYRGTADQNLKMLELLKEGKLRYK